MDEDLTPEYLRNYNDGYKLAGKNDELASEFMKRYNADREKNKQYKGLADGISQYRLEMIQKEMLDDMFKDSDKRKNRNRL